MKLNSTAIAGVILLGLIIHKMIPNSVGTEKTENEPQNIVRELLKANATATVLWQDNLPILACKIGNKTVVIQTIGAGVSVPAFTGNLPSNYAFGTGSGGTYVIDNQGLTKYVGTATNTVLISQRLKAIGVAQSGQSVDSASSSGKSRYEVASLRADTQAKDCGFK